MDLRTGKMYPTKEEALKAGVPESDIAELSGEFDKVRNQIPKVKFSKNLFGSFKNVEPVEK